MIAETFLQKAILLILDKIAIGGIIILIGYFVNRALERYKSNQAVREAMEKKRIEIIAPLWQKLNDVHLFVTHRINLKGLISSKEELEVIINEYNEKETLAIDNAREQRFWLGKELSKKLFDYLDTIRNLKYAIENVQKAFRTKSSMEGLLEKMEADSHAAIAAFLDIDEVLYILTNSKMQKK